MAEDRDNLDETLNTSRDKSESGGSRVGNYAKDKAKDKAKQQAKKAVEKSAKKAAKAGAKAGKASSLTAFFATPVGWAVLIIIGIIVAILLIIGAVSFFTNMPGMISAKLEKLKQDMLYNLEVRWTEDNDVTGLISEQTKIDLAQYIKDMGYDLVGYGFLTNVTYYNEDDPQVQSGEKEKGDVKSITTGDNDNIFAYIFAEQRIYTMKWQGTGSFKQLLKDAFGHMGGVGLIYNAAGNIIDALGGGSGLPAKFHNFGEGMLNINYPADEKNDLIKDGKVSVITDENGKLLLRSKITNPDGIDLLNQDKYDYEIEGWVGRYGTPLELSLTMHLATMSPDFVYDWLTNKNLETVVNIKLEKIEYNMDIYYEYTAYDEDGNIIPDEEGNTIRKITTAEVVALIDEYFAANSIETRTIDYDYVDGDDRITEWNHLQDDTTTTENGSVYTPAELEKMAEMVAKLGFIEYETGSTFSSVTTVQPTLSYGDDIYVKDENLKDVTKLGNEITTSDTDNGGFKLKYKLYDRYSDSSSHYWNVCPSLSEILNEYRTNDDADINQMNITLFGENSDYAAIIKTLDEYIESARGKIGEIPEGTEIDTKFKIDEYVSSADNYYSLIYNAFEEMRTNKGNGMLEFASYQLSRTILDSLISDVKKSTQIYMALQSEVNDNPYKLTYLEAVEIASLIQNRDVEVYQPRITTVEKHWFKDVDFRGTYGTTPAGTTEVYEYSVDAGEKKVSDRVSGRLMVSQTNKDAIYKNDKQPYVIKGDIVTQNGEKVSGYDIGNGEYDTGYTLGSGYTVTKKLFTQGMYYVYDGSEATAKEIALAKEIESYAKGKKLAITVKDGRIIRVVDYGSTADNINTQFESATGGTTYIVAAPGKYISPVETNDVDYATSKASADTINELLEKIGSSLRRRPVTFDNETALSAFAILEGTHSLDAEYIYRDLKELIIDLGYFTKAEFEAVDTNVLDWLLPGYIELEWPSVNDQDTYQFSKTIKSEATTTANGDEKPGFAPDLDVVAPGAGRIKATTGDSVTIEFDIELDTEHPEAEIVNKWTIYIQGIQPEGLAVGTIVQRGTVIGKTTQKDIKVLLRDGATSVINNIEDYMAPPVFAIGNDYDVCIEHNGGVNVVKDVETFKKMFEGYPKIVENAEAFMKMQEQYRVNAVFAAAVSIAESSGGTNWGANQPHTNNWFNITGSTDKYTSWVNSGSSNKLAWRVYPSVEEGILDFGNYIGNNPNYYFIKGEYLITEIAKHYCPPGLTWSESVSKYMTEAFERGGLVTPSE